MCFANSFMGGMNIGSRMNGSPNQSGGLFDILSNVNKKIKGLNGSALNFALEDLLPTMRTAQGLRKSPDVDPSRMPTLLPFDEDIEMPRFNGMDTGLSYNPMYFNPNSMYSGY